MSNDIIKYSPDWWVHRCRTQYTNRELNSKFIIGGSVGLALQNVYTSNAKTLPLKVLHISIDTAISPIERQEICEYLDIPIFKYKGDIKTDKHQRGLIVTYDDNYCISDAIEVYDNGLRVIDACQFLIDYLKSYYNQCTKFFEKYNGLVEGFGEYLRNFNHAYIMPRGYDFTALNLFKMLSNLVESKRINSGMLGNTDVYYRLYRIYDVERKRPKRELYVYDYADFDDEEFEMHINKWLKSEYGYYTHLASKLLELAPKSKLAMIADTRLVEFIADLSTVQLKIRDFLSKRGYTYSIYRFKWNEEKQQVEVVGTIGDYNY